MDHQRAHDSILHLWICWFATCLHLWWAITGVMTGAFPPQMTSLAFFLALGGPAVWVPVLLIASGCAALGLALTFLHTSARIFLLVPQQFLLYITAGWGIYLTVLNPTRGIARISYAVLLAIFHTIALVHAQWLNHSEQSTALHQRRFTLMVGGWNPMLFAMEDRKE